jgi:G3E family GTPase
MIIIVDAAEFPLETTMLLRYARLQVEKTDIICLNKMDVADKERTSKLKSMFKYLNSKANVLEISAKEGTGISEFIYSLG